MPRETPSRDANGSHDDRRRAAAYHLQLACATALSEIKFKFFSVSLL